MRTCPRCNIAKEDQDFICNCRKTPYGNCASCRLEVAQSFAGRWSHVNQGVDIGEAIVEKCFDVIRMPYGNPGYDFICRKDNTKIDVKSACLSKCGFLPFVVNGNNVADWFFCIGFDNVNFLEPIKFYIFPRRLIRNQKSITVYKPFELNKWQNEYERPIDELVKARRELQ